ncbi:MAG: glycosyltransferase family 2 protein [Planctomycetota bacterium]
MIPVLDEERAIPLVLAELPSRLVDDVVVVDNGSRDASALEAERHGARVVREPRRGYGSACRAGIEAAGDADVIVFLDGDHSDYPEDLPLILGPILEGQADLVIGSRMILPESRRALLPQARFGNRVASWLMKALCGIRCTDLGPFRAIRRRSLDALDLSDPDYGWTVEMQLAAKREGLRVREVPVRYRARIGRSKITGTLRGSLLAGWKILRAIARHRFASAPARASLHERRQTTES